MAKLIFTFVFLVSVFYRTNGEDVALPSYITPCNHKDPNFNQCVKAEVIKAIPNFKHGDKLLGVSSLDPLILTKNLDVKQNGLDLTFSDVAVYGLGDAKIQNVQFNDNQFRLEFTTDIKIVAGYKVDGKILILPIKGEGNSTIKAYNTHIDITCPLSVHKTDNAEHYQIKDPNFTYDIKKTIFDFQNLFYGNKQLADQTQKFINEKSDVIMADVAPPVIKQIVTEAVKNVAKIFTKIPINKLVKE